MIDRCKKNVFTLWESPPPKAPISVLVTYELSGTLFYCVPLQALNPTATYAPRNSFLRTKKPNAALLFPRDLFHPEAPICTQQHTPRRLVPLDEVPVLEDPGVDARHPVEAAPVAHAPVDQPDGVPPAGRGPADQRGAAVPGAGVATGLPAGADLTAVQGEGAVET